jgi:hypothetical protein
MSGSPTKASIFSFCVAFTLLVNIIIILILSETNLTFPTSSPPTYRNSDLEKIIADNKEAKTLHLDSECLTDQDMEIVAYYVLRNTTVSQTTFAHVPSDISTIISSGFFREDNLSNRMLHKFI